MIVVLVEAGFVKQADQVDVGAVVELPRPHLAHGQRHHAAARNVVLRVAPGSLPRLISAPRRPSSPDARPDRQRSVSAAGHLLQRPDPAQIGQRRSRAPPAAWPAAAPRQGPARRHRAARQNRPAPPPGRPSAPGSQPASFSRRASEIGAAPAAPSTSGQTARTGRERARASARARGRRGGAAGDADENPCASDTARQGLVNAARKWNSALGPKGRKPRPMSKSLKRVAAPCRSRGRQPPVEIGQANTAQMAADLSAAPSTRSPSRSSSAAKAARRSCSSPPAATRWTRPAAAWRASRWQGRRGADPRADRFRHRRGRAPGPPDRAARLLRPAADGFRNGLGRRGHAAPCLCHRSPTCADLLRGRFHRAQVLISPLPQTARARPGSGRRHNVKNFTSLLQTAGQYRPCDVKGIHIQRQEWPRNEKGHRMNPPHQRFPRVTTGSGWLSRAEAWLDERARAPGSPPWCWLHLFWPVGLALLAYMIWSKNDVHAKAAA